MRKIHRIAACCALGSLIWFGRPAFIQGAEEPIAGINPVLYDAYANHANADKLITEILEKEIPSSYQGLSFANVNNYVNIRTKPTETADIVGKLYNNGSATIIDKSGDWYQIKSGSVQGYIRGDYLITGEQASELSDKLGKQVAQVAAKALRVREKATTNSSIITQVTSGEELKVTKAADEWIKVSVNGKSGYVSSDFVKVKTVYETAISLEEEKKNNAVKNVSTASKSTYRTASLSVGSQIASYAMQYQGNPYRWGGTSLTRGADCSGFVQSVFENFGYNLPRTSRAQANGGKRIPVSDVGPGDLIFYAKNGRINHVAIYIGNGRVISASSPKAGIKVAAYNYRTPVRAVRYLR